MFSIEKKEYSKMLTNQEKKVVYEEDNKKNSHHDDNDDSVVEDEEEYEEYDETEEDKDKISYHFLDKLSNPLSKRFGDFHNDDHDIFQIYFCIYKINTECKIPFIEILIDDKCFPKITDFRSPYISNEIDHNSTHTYFMNECLIKLLKILKLNQEFGIELFDKMFKGLHEKDDKITVVFESFSETNNDLNWVILDEILSFDKEIDGNVKEFFEENDFMNKIYKSTEYEEVYSMPFLMYLCEKKETYHTLSYPSLIDEKTDGVSWLGDFFYFSTEIFDTETEKVGVYQKYAVFTESASYILKDIALITEEERKFFIDKNIDEDIMVIYYQENGKQLWCVKTNDLFTRV